MNLGEILDVEAIRKFRRLFYEYSGMISSLYFPNSKIGQMECIPVDGKCEFCRIIRRSAKGLEECRLADQRAAETIQTGMKPIVFACHAGLTGIAAPILFEGECQGAVLAGDVLTHPPTASSFSRTRKALRGLDIDFEELEAAYYRIPVVSHRSIRLAVETLSLIVNYIIDREQIISLQQRLYEKQEEISLAIIAQEDSEKGLHDKLDEIDTLRKQLAMATSASNVVVLSEDSGARRKRIAEEMLSFVDQYYTAGITLNDVAEHVGLSPNYVSTLFHKECGFTLMEYLVIKRISKARDLLQELGLNVSEVRSRVGYRNMSHFNRMFKKLVGVAPGEYRNRVLLQRRDEVG
ncbi:MAG: PocR ligand-binding domain-containing protein [Armatimonadota bacterium]